MTILALDGINLRRRTRSLVVSHFLMFLVLLAIMALNASNADAQSSPADPPIPEEPFAFPHHGLIDEVDTVNGEGLDSLAGGDTEIMIVSGVCIFFTRGDYVHISSTAFEASGHGWWINVNCPTQWALVTVQLQQQPSNGRWQNAGTVGRATVRSGGGAGNRATGRARCSGGDLTAWRSIVDVDLIGLQDDPTPRITPVRYLRCRH